MKESLKDQEKNQRSNQPESDSQRVVREHLEDENHVISDDDIRNVRIGITPDEVDTAKNVEKFIDPEKPKKSDKDASDEQVTPWDVIND